MINDDEKILENINYSIHLMADDFNNNSENIRKQLVKNKELIEGYSTYLKHNNFDSNNLINLEQEQSRLLTFFNHNWKYEIINPFDKLKFNKLYRSQTFILVEWHAGMVFNHLFINYFQFFEDGFMRITSEKPNRTFEEVKSRIDNLGKDYLNLYELDEFGTIKFRLRNNTFKGTLLHDSIVGKKIKIGKYKDGIVEDRDEIIALIEK